ncbi:MAG: MotA/TolQ/ExbB proton channel family protein [Bdellovibrionales bacterium]|jgi:biopolymer transport protein ExbB|nr:MotA/TolQ/ExbB proton channel family protein [Bdellovibrionales bacterium]
MWVIDFMKKFLMEGGATAYVILGAGMALIVLAYDRLSFLYFRMKPLPGQVLDQINQAILNRKYMEALQICNTLKDIPQIQVIKAGLIAVESGREAMKSSLGSAVVEVSKDCDRRIPLISLIASVATLLGLLGTISGLIKTFAAIAKADPKLKSEMLGAGISEAMNATAAGLVVGISAMIVYTLCISKIEELISQSKKTGYDFVTLVEQSEREG